MPIQVSTLSSINRNWIEGQTGGSVVKKPPANARHIGGKVLIHGSGRSPEGEMASYSSVLDERNSMTGASGGPGISQARVGHFKAIEMHTCRGQTRNLAKALWGSCEGCRVKTSNRFLCCLLPGRGVLVLFLG